MKKIIVDQDIWLQKCRNLKERVNAKLKTYFINKSNHQKHPVIDFLFEYYSFGFSELKRWSPGVGVFLQGERAHSFLGNNFYKQYQEGISINPQTIPESRRSSLLWILELMKTTRERAPFWGCLGLHEWAMVYRSKHIRHNTPLRLSREEIAAFVEKSNIHCSHYDAYRFFTKDALKLNNLCPKKETRQQLEQAGCLHTNMDLYKWAYKFYPWVNSDLIMDTFDLALEIREVDMRAAPYDLKYLGYYPILIETMEGCQEYISLQKKFYEKAQILRKRLIEVYQNIVQEIT